MIHEEQRSSASKAPFGYVDLTDRSIMMAGVVFLASLVLYTVTLAPGLLWGGGDFALYQTLAGLGQLDTGSGVFAHPLWVLAAQPFTWLPIQNVAWRANFASSVFAATALGFVFLVSRRLTRSTAAALLGTIALAVSHTFWTYAVMPKVYSLNALLVAGCTYLLIRWRETTGTPFLYGFAFLYGLSFLNHLVMAVVGPGFLVFIGIVLWRNRSQRAALRSLTGSAIAFAMGLAPYVVMTLRAGKGARVGGSALRFLSGLVYPLTHPDALLTGAGWGALLGGYQFPLTLAIGGLGLYVLWRRDRAVAMLIALAVAGTVAFLFGALDPRAGGVYVWNLHYYLQAYLFFALAIAAGLDVVWERWAAAAPSRTQPHAGTHGRRRPRAGLALRRGAGDHRALLEKRPRLPTAAGP